MSKINQNNQESNPRLFKKWCGVLNFISCSNGANKLAGFRK